MADVGYGRFIVRLNSHQLTSQLRGLAFKKQPNLTEFQDVDGKIACFMTNPLTVRASRTPAQPDKLASVFVRIFHVFRIMSIPDSTSRLEIQHSRESGLAGTAHNVVHRQPVCPILSEW